MNLIILTGRAASTPEIVRYNNKNNPEQVDKAAKLFLAVPRSYSKTENVETDFFNCVAFKKTAEFIEKYVNKGTKITVTGALRNNIYEKDGTKVRNQQVLIRNIEFAESRRQNGEAAETENGKQEPPMESDGFMNIPEEIEELFTT